MKKAKLLFLSLAAMLCLSAADAKAAKTEEDGGTICLLSPYDAGLGTDDDADAHPGLYIWRTVPGQSGGPTFNKNPFNDKTFMDWYRNINTAEHPIAIYFDYDENGNLTVWFKWIKQ